MSLEFSYYPGCAGKQVQKEADWSAQSVCDALGIKLHAMPAATCCGAVSLQEAKPAFSLAVAARIMSQAEAHGRDIVTICNTCLQTLSHANHRFKEEPELLEQINDVLEQADVRPYGATIEVRHLVWVVTELVDRDLLKSKIVKPLKGLKVAPFYGCHNVRPSWIFSTKRAGSKADHLDDLIDVMGGEAVQYDGKFKCCGFHVMLSDPTEMRNMVANNCLDAKGGGAEVMITPCTLCDMSMGAYQGVAEKTTGKQIGLPEMNFSQLLGLAMGIDKSKLGISRLHVSPDAVLQQKGLL